MKSIAFTIIIWASLFNNIAAAELASDTQSGEAEVDVDVAPNTEGVDANTQANEKADFCFFGGLPSSDIEYVVIRKLKVAKGTYGGVKEILPRLVDHARKIGADAIIHYTGSQRFGFFPWRTVRPVVRGVAVRWASAQKPDCSKIGGSTLREILATDRPPAR